MNPQTQPDQPDPLLGKTLAGRFRLIELIGQGGMGRVYRAEQAPLNRAVAVKVLTFSGDASFSKRFQHEAAVTARLTHPNTITLIDYGVDAGIAFIAMELLSGRTLSEALRKEGAFTPERAVRIAAQICRSLREAHAMGVVHRDLKPSNVFLVENRDDHEFVKVLDFGLAKSTVRDEDITNQGLFMGTPHYLSPEQARSLPLDARSDVYSLGVLLYAMLAGRLPFEGQNSLDVVIAHIQTPPRPLPAGLPEALVAVVMRCLSKSPDDRPQSMDALLAELKAVDGMSAAAVTAVVSVPPGLADARTPTRQQTPPAMLAGSEPPIAMPPPPPRSFPRAAVIGGAIAAAVLGVVAFFTLHRQPAPPRAAPASASTSAPEEVAAAAVGNATDTARPESRARNVPGFVLLAGAKRTPVPQLSSAAIASLGSARSGTYRLCAVPAGDVDEVEPVVQRPAADAEVVAALRTWKLAAQPERTCGMVRVEYR